MTIIVRQAVANDTKELAIMLTEAAYYKAQAHDDHAWKDIEANSYEFGEDEIAQYIDRGNAYVIEYQNHIVGTLALLWEDTEYWGERPPDAGYIHRLALRNSHRGQNLGTEILDWATQEVLKNNRSYLRLDCSPDNLRLCNYYESLGFVRQGIKETLIVDTLWRSALYERKLK